VLGGSSAINASTYMRGHRRCFDGWRDAGNPGWGYDDLLSLFTRSERYDGEAASHRGSDGPLVVSRTRDPHDSHEAFLLGASAQGFRADRQHDFNVAEPQGVAGFLQKNILNGRRQSAADAYLTPALGRANLTIRMSTQVARLIVDRRRVTGVEHVCDGRLGVTRAHRGVVVCAGAIASPRILMSSGIGPADELRAHGIGVVADIAGVGRNLQDHLKLSIRWRGRTTLPASNTTASLLISSNGGPLPDLQFYVGRGVDQPDPFVTITVALVRPQSRGTIELRSADPLAAPCIRPQYLRSQADVAALVSGVRYARAIGMSAAYHRLRGEEVDPGMDVTGVHDVERFVRARAETIYHPAGTCRMGPSSDRCAVVDASLRVHGVDGLRVADAAIMPDVVDAPTHAAAVMIGEKCAEMMVTDGD
jgi:choline dehydrogenase